MKPFKVAWADIWDDMRPWVTRVLETGEPTWTDDLPLVMNRHGYDEETYFTFSFGIGRDEAGDAGGIFCIVQETSERVMRERRLEALRALTGDARSAAEGAALAVIMLGAQQQ